MDTFSLSTSRSLFEPCDVLLLTSYMPFAEIEALEAITWLEQAGFPQYVQLFEDSQLPIDIETVQKDHSFLDEHQLRSLYRSVSLPLSVSDDGHQMPITYRLVANG